MAMLGAVSAFLSLVAAMIIAIRFDAKKYRKQTLSDAKRKRLNESKRKEDERSRLEEENKHLRLQLGLPPHRREAPPPKPAKSNSQTSSKKNKGIGSPVPMSILVAGTVALMYSARLKQESKKKTKPAKMSKAELASAYHKMRAKSQKNLQPVASVFKVNCTYCGASFTKAESHCPSCGAPKAADECKEDSDGEHEFISQLHDQITLNSYMGKIIDVNWEQNGKES